MKNKYSEIMDHVKVDAEMRERVLQAALLKGYEAEEETRKQAESTKNEKPVRKEAENGEDDSGRKKDRKVSFPGRMNRLTAAAAAILVFALAGIGFVTVSMRSRPESAAESAAVAEETDAAAEDTAVKAEGGTANETAAAEAEEAAEEAEESLHTAPSEDTAYGIEENADTDAAGPDGALRKGDEISVTKMIGMLSEPASMYSSESGTKTFLTVPGILLFGCEGELELQWEKDVIYRVIWTESDTAVSFSRLAEMITEKLGSEPEKIRSEDTGGQDGSAETSSDGAYVYVWVVDGKTVTLRPDLKVEVMP